jgi:hypothetical protein
LLPQHKLKFKKFKISFEKIKLKTLLQSPQCGVAAAVAASDFFGGEKSPKGDNCLQNLAKMGLFFEKQIAKLRQFKLFLGESVATGLGLGATVLMAKSLKLSPFMSHFDSGLSPPLRHCRFGKRKKPWNLQSSK